ncbi:MFS transporter [Providencia stuartii]|uniref:MFS transporter n=1 Tax=Providencia stuartii TaxID=588 RepID=UPI00300360E9
MMLSQRYLLLVFAAAVYLVGTTEFMLSATLTPLAEVFSVDPIQVSWLISAYALTYAITAPVLGYFSDRVDRRKLLLAGMLLFAIDSLAIIASPSFGVALIFRICGGLASAIIVPTVFALIADIVPSSQQPVAMGQAMLGMTLGIVLGPVFAGVLTEYAAWYVPFIMTAIGSFIVWFCAYRILPSHQPYDIRQKQASFRWLRDFKLIRLVGAKALWNGSAVSVFLLAGEVLRHKFKIDSAVIGMVISAFGVGLLVGNWQVKSLSKILYNNHQRLFAVVTLMSIAIIVFMIANYSLLIAIVILFIWGNFLGMAAPLSASIIATESGENKGQVLAVSESLNNIVLFTMLPFLSWLLNQFELKEVGAMVAIILVSALLISLFSMRKNQEG